jgi:hypothetical protein
MPKNLTTIKFPACSRAALRCAIVLSRTIGNAGSMSRTRSDTVRSIGSGSPVVRRTTAS